MADINIIERAVVPVNPAPTRVEQKDKYTLYAPTASSSQAGMASFNADDFTVTGGVVSINTLREVSNIRRIDVTPDVEIPDDVKYEGINGVKSPGYIYYNYTNDVEELDGSAYTRVSKTGELLVFITPIDDDSYRQTEVFYTNGENYIRALTVELNDEEEYEVTTVSYFKSGNTGLSALQYSTIVDYNYEGETILTHTTLNIDRPNSEHFNRTPVVGDKIMYVAKNNSVYYLVIGIISSVEVMAVVTVKGLIRLNSSSVAHADNADNADSASDYAENGGIDTKFKEVEQSIEDEIAGVTDIAGNKIAISVNDEYVVTVSLLNSSDTVLSTSSIDLPIESLVMNAELIGNNTLRLHLQNGNYVDIDISAMLSGIVPETRTVNGHRLNADVVLVAGDVDAYTKDDVDEFVDMLEEQIKELLNMKYPIATVEKAGIVKPDGRTVVIQEDGTITVTAEASVNVATTAMTGVVKPDGTTITITEDGTISADIPGIATTAKEGLVKPDGTTITITEDGTISAEQAKIATVTDVGLVKPDGTTITITADGTISAEFDEVEIATTEKVGTVKPDGTTIIITADGTISAEFDEAEVATTAKAGIVKPDGDTITITTDGTISADVPDIATTADVGIVKPDGSSITITEDGTISAKQASVATTADVGLVKPDGTTIVITSDGTISAEYEDVDIATTESVGTVKPDGTTITITADGTISAEYEDVDIATTESTGVVQPDGTTITITAEGVISAVAGSTDVELTQAEYDELTEEEQTNGTTYFITDGVPTVKSLVQTLTAGETEVTFTSILLTNDCMLDWYTDKIGLNPVSGTPITNNSITLTFEAQEEDVSVKVVIS